MNNPSADLSNRFSNSLALAKFLNRLQPLPFQRIMRWKGILNSTGGEHESVHGWFARPRGTQLTCKSWLTEAPYRMIQNNLDPEVAERPQDLVVYGGRGQAARSWEAFDAILDSLQELEDDETLLVQSGKPVVVFKTPPRCAAGADC